jgi:GTP:adenosylcobinamide-phosphate guanylyltransferase
MHGNKVDVIQGKLRESSMEECVITTIMTVLVALSYYSLYETQGQGYWDEWPWNVQSLTTELFTVLANLFIIKATYNFLATKSIVCDLLVSRPEN